MTQDSPLAPPTDSGRIIAQVIEEEMKSSYLDYAMSVIVGRALPDVRDGLKPVHRRILFAMHELGNASSKPYKKSARIVGECLGKFHPHGDTAVYDSLVRMVQNFSLRYPLVDGQGNFGSVDGDNAAAQRYTEARLAPLAEEMLRDIEKETVKLAPNFDGSLKEPTVLPSAIPNLLVNGSAGIAVGMATNIPPHNIIEVCDAICKQIDNPQIEIVELAKTIQGPDFPTGGQICGTGGIMSCYLYGRGKIIVRATILEEKNQNKNSLIVTEIPYQVNKSQLIEEIAGLVRDKSIPGISDIRDESDREGMRIVIELKKDATAAVVQNQLYKHSRLQVTFGAMLLALVDNQPIILSLKQTIAHFIEHRKEVITKRTQFELAKAQKRHHILEGLIIALNNIDRAIALIKQAKSAAVAEEVLIREFTLSVEQAKAILDMKLQKLTNLEQQKIRDEQEQLKKLIARLEQILANESEILRIIKEEMEEIKKKYGDARRTKIIPGDDTIIEAQDMIADDEMVVTISHTGYIKRTQLDTYRQQQRGGKGVIGQAVQEEDSIKHLFVATNHSYILFFTTLGQVHWQKVFEIPEFSRTSRGKAVVNLIPLQEGEKVAATISMRELEKEEFLVLVTRAGILKKSALAAYAHPRKGGIRAITLDQGDALVTALRTTGKNQIIICTKKGMAIRFHEDDARAIGRTSRGVKGMTLRDGDSVIGAIVADENKTILTITENGYGKLSPISEYRIIGRGGIGVINIKTTERNGDVVAALSIEKENDLIMVSQKGNIVRIPASSISVIGRNTQGFRLMKLDPLDRIVGAAAIMNEEETTKEVLQALTTPAPQKKEVIDIPPPSFITPPKNDTQTSRDEDEDYV